MTKTLPLRENYPRVSDIISVFTEREMRTIPIEKLVQASERGTKVHAYCTSYMNGYFLPKIEESCELYVNSFIDWHDSFVEKVHSTSERLYDDQLKYSGEYDAIVSLKGREGLFLMDIKTSCVPAKSWPLQLAAYKNLCEKNGWEITGVFNLHLKKTYSSKKGEEKKLTVKAKDLFIEQLHHYEKIFFSALDCHAYFFPKFIHDKGGE